MCVLGDAVFSPRATTDWRACRGWSRRAWCSWLWGASEAYNLPLAACNVRCEPPCDDSSNVTLSTMKTRATEGSRRRGYLQKQWPLWRVQRRHNRLRFNNEFMLQKLDCYIYKLPRSLRYLVCLKPTSSVSLSAVAKESRVLAMTSCLGYTLASLCNNLIYETKIFLSSATRNACIFCHVYYSNTFQFPLLGFFCRHFSKQIHYHVVEYCACAQLVPLKTTWTSLAQKDCLEIRSNQLGKVRYLAM